MSRLMYAAAAGFISRLLASFLTRSSRSTTALKWRLKAGQDNNLVAAPTNAAHLVNINPGTQSTVTACRFIFICIQSS